jgi:hypothetical protein
MKDYYNIYIDGKRIGKSESYQEALGYVKENYNDMIKRMDWEPRGSGGVDLWDNGINSIMIEKYYPSGIDLEHLANEHKKISQNDNKDDDDNNQIDHEQKSKMPYTPQRTTLKMKRKKKASVMKLGEIKEGEDGNMYICKEKSNGRLYWTRYVEKTYEGSPKKRDLPKEDKKTRKCPSRPAKEFKPETTKKGEDGKIWITKKMNNGNLRWIRKGK